MKFIDGVILCFSLVFGVSSSPSQEQFVRPGSGSWSNEGRDFSPNVLLLSDSHLLNTKPVMVSFKPGSAFANSLRGSDNTIAFFSSHKLNRGRAVLKITSPAERDRLAALAHNDIHACGAIESVYPNLTSASLGDAFSPIIPTSVRATGVQALVDAISSANISATVSSFQALGTRFHAGSSPNTASDLVNSLWTSSLPAGGATIQQKTHSDTTQKSVVLKIPGTDVNGKSVIIGAHLDSINHNNNANAPGADDDASGIAVLTEILRVIKTSGATFTRPVEFHAYAAEEVGLIGSHDLALAASAANQTIAGMLQFDMVGYAANQGSQTIHLVTTDTSPILVRHMKDLLAGYLGGNWKTGELSAGTSDHRSWYRIGVHTAFAFEDPDNYNHALHTEADKTDRLDFSLAARFAKLGAAFLAHEAGLVSAATDVRTAWGNQLATQSQVKLAINKSDDGGYKLAAAVASGLNAQTAEICKVSSGVEYGCQNLVTSLDLAATKNNRAFFISADAIPIQSGDIWRFHLYDAAGSLLALRTVKLSR